MLVQIVMLQIQGDKDDTYDPSDDLYYECKLLVDGIDLDTASQTISIGELNELT